MLQAESFKNTIDTLNVNQQMIIPRSPFDVYWNNLSETQANAPRASKVLDPILEGLQANQIYEVQVRYSRSNC